MSQLTEKIKTIRNNGSRKDSHIKLANDCIKQVEELERQLTEIKQKRQGAALNEMMEWSTKELAELVIDLLDENNQLETQLQESETKK